MKGKRLTFKDLTAHPVNFLSLGFGSGLSPVAPGTFGTLVAVPLYLLFAQLDIALYIGLTLLITLVGIWFCDVTANNLGVHDHSGIVWDEIAGYLITMIAAPPGWVWVVVGFVLFRLFDILKPWPIRWLDKHVQGGFGIMIDDVLAGIMSLLVLQLLYFYTT
jgi:phosphatidylglycerophosphatase A